MDMGYVLNTKDTMDVIEEVSRENERNDNSAKGPHGCAERGNRGGSQF
jgi:hypothetical protein